MTNSVDPDQTRSSQFWVHAVCFYNLSVMLGNYLQQTTVTDVFFLGALRVNPFILMDFSCTY